MNLNDTAWRLRCQGRTIYNFETRGPNSKSKDVDIDFEKLYVARAYNMEFYFIVRETINEVTTQVPAVVSKTALKSYDIFPLNYSQDCDGPQMNYSFSGFDHTHSLLFASTS
jgi:hypothetical protein